LGFLALGYVLRRYGFMTILAKDRNERGTKKKEHGAIRMPLNPNTVKKQAHKMEQNRDRYFLENHPCFFPEPNQDMQTAK
jgi:hypothetical protein